MHRVHSRAAPGDSGAALDDPEAALDDRTRRARTEPMSVRALGGGSYRVDAASGNEYTVDLPGGRCTCPDHRYRGVWCKHLRRVASEVAAGRVPRPGLAPVECSVCGREFLVEEPTRPPHRCERCSLDVGDLAVDRAGEDLVVVAAAPAGRADETPVPGHDVTVADYPGNERFPRADPVVEVVYPPPADLTAEQLDARKLRRYRFPVSRLRPVGAE